MERGKERKEWEGLAPEKKKLPARKSEKSAPMPISPHCCTPAPENLQTAKKLIKQLT